MDHAKKCSSPFPLIYASPFSFALTSVETTWRNVQNILNKVVA